MKPSTERTESTNASKECDAPIYSRKIIGWQVYESKSSELASEVMRDICMRENIAPKQVVLHSDNGSPMKGATMLPAVTGARDETNTPRPRSSLAAHASRVADDA